MKADRVNFWDTMQLMLPAAAGLLPLFVVWASGGFYAFVWIGQNASPAEGFAILAALCWPVAAHFYVRTQTDTIQGQESVGWPTVHGRLVAWQVRPILNGRLNRLVARYSYDFDGERYEGDLVAFGPKYVRDSAALDFLKTTYRPGMDVTLHHAPDQPALAVLLPGDGIAQERLPLVRLLFGAPLLYPVMAILFSF